MNILLFKMYCFLIFIRKQYKNIKLKIIAPKWNDRLKFKIKDGYKPELQTPETMKLFGSTKVFSVFENL